MQKRILCFFIAVALCVSLFPSPIWAALESEDEAASAMTENKSLVSLGVFGELGSVEATAQEDSSSFSGLNCHEMTELWFGKTEASLLDADASNTPEKILSAYFTVRESAFPGTMLLFSAQDIAISKEVQAQNIQHTQAIQSMQERLNIIITDADVTTRILEDYTISADDGLMVIYAYEWTFYDYDNLADGIGGSDVSGYGTYHKITLNKEEEFRIVSDEYDESDIFGVNTISHATKVSPNKVDRILSPDMERGNVSDEIALNNEEAAFLLSPNYYESYNPYKAAEYADTYWSDYNPAYYNFGLIKGAGDCANFTSQCIDAGGMPQVRGSAYGVNGWYYVTSNDRSATWTGAGELRVWMANNRGLQLTANNANVWLGSPVFYNSNAHAVICVGRDSSGAAIIDSHTRDRYHALWNYYGASTTQTVQLTATEPGQHPYVDVGTDFYAYIINTTSWLHLTNDSDGNVTARTLSGAANQIWHFERLGSGAYKITSLENSNQCLDVANFGQTSGTNVGVANANGTSAQQWFIYGENAAYEFRAECTNCVMDIKNADYVSGVNVQMWERNGTDAQKFQIWKLDASGDALDINWILDGNQVWGEQGYGTVDVYINGELKADDVTDYCAEWPMGTRYEITDIKAKDGHTYMGISNGSLSGMIIHDRVEVWLNFATVLANLDVNGWLDGQYIGGLGDYGTVDVYINGSRVADDVSDYYEELSSGTSYEIRDIKPKNGYSYDGLREGTRVGSIGSGTVNLAFAFSKIDASGVSAPRAEGTFNNHIYLLCDKEVTWYAARQLCEFMGGHLVTINSEEENQFVHSLRGENRVWLGATHASGAWEWITGEAFSYDKWAEGEWNNATDNDEGSENYAEQAYWDGTWNDLPGYVARGFVCEIDRAPASVANGVYRIFSAVDGRSLDVSGAGTAQGTNIQTWANLGTDSQKFTVTKDGDYCTVVALHSGMAMDVEGAVASSGVNVSQCPLNGNNAQKWMFEDAGDGDVYIHSALGCYLDVCGGEAKDGANIWTYFFNGTPAQKFRLEPVANYLDVNGYLDGAASGGLGDYGTVDVYINGSLVADDVSDYYAECPSGTSYEIRDIKPKAGYSYDGVHEGARTGSVGLGTVTVTFKFSTIDTANLPEAAKTETFNGHTYSLYSGPVTWYAAKRLCEAMGGHLVTITSEEENSFVLALRGTDWVWIGATDSAEEEKWEWITGEAFQFDKWASEEPNNTHSNEEYGENYAHQVYDNGVWNDAAGCGKYAFVCEIDSASNAPQIVISDRTAAPGSSVRVPVLLKNNPGLVSFRFKVAYDASKLELTGVDNADYNLVALQNLNSPVVFNFTDATGGDKTDTGAGVLNFNVKDGASGEAAFSVTIDDPDDFYNSQNQSVAFSVAPGKVTIKDYTPGDVNNDGKVNNRDVGRLQQFLSDWDVEIVRDASDTNGDGKVNNRDVGRLQQFLSDWDVTLCGGIETETQSGGARLQSAGSLTIAIDGRTATPGETIQVPVLLKDNPGLVSFRFKVSYDSSKLELTGRDDADYALVALKDLNSPVVFNFTDATGGDKRAVNAGVLNFKVKDGASGDAEFSVTVDDPDDFYNTSEDTIGVEISAGAIRIVPGSDVSASIGKVQRNADNAVTANVACSDRTATVFCAVYNSAGKMIAVKSAQVTESDSYDFRFGNAQFDYAKIFVLDSNFMPLCGSAKTA